MQKSLKSLHLNSEQNLKNSPWIHVTTQVLRSFCSMIRFMCTPSGWWYCKSRMGAQKKLRHGDMPFLNPQHHWCLPPLHTWIDMMFSRGSAPYLPGREHPNFILFWVALWCCCLCSRWGQRPIPTSRFENHPCHRPPIRRQPDLVFCSLQLKLEYMANLTIPIFFSGHWK